MMYRFKHQSGFSLIELIVVMAIMSLLLSLSGGLFQKNISQQERHVELEQVNQLFRQLSYRAYFTGQASHLRLEKNQVYKLLIDQKEDIDAILQSFKQLTFVAEEYHISAQGIVSPNYFSVFWGNNIKIHPIKSTFNEIPKP